MHINRVLIDHLRNLEKVSINHLADLNFFVGSNGAGKTSFLEAISIASQGRSFRNNKIQTVICEAQPELRVFVECVDENRVTHKLGIQRDRQGNYLVRIDGMTASSLAELSFILPTVVLDSTAFELLDGSPAVRRKFIDWGVFHVEQGFYEKWRSLSRILMQRNALLRTKVTDYRLFLPWDVEMAALAIDIENHRLSFLGKYATALQSSISTLDADLGDCQLFYRNGWCSERLDFNDVGAHPHMPVSVANELLDMIRQGFEKDCRYQRTHLGPHKADIQLRSGKNDVKDVYSRGQKKSLIASMKLAQASVVKSVTNKRPILLLDDLPSELDSVHLDCLLRHVADERYQCFITAVDDRIYREYASVKSRMFHVERGRISPINAQGDSQE